MTNISERTRATMYFFHKYLTGQDLKDAVELYDEGYSDVVPSRAEQALLWGFDWDKGVKPRNRSWNTISDTLPKDKEPIPADFVWPMVSEQSNLDPAISFEGKATMISEAHSSVVVDPMKHELIAIEKDEHEASRKHLWISAWSSAASAFNIQTPKDATRWADAALKDFDERFVKEV